MSTNIKGRLAEMTLGLRQRPAPIDAMLKQIDGVVERLNLIALIDASGRSGNVFFVTLFDQHPEVACCPIVQYTYSYLASRFGNSTVLDAKLAHEFVTQSSYFRLLYNEPVGANGDLIVRMGGDVAAVVDRQVIRDLLDAYFSRHKTVTRREVVLAPLVVYALARGFSLDCLKYVLVGDSISLREEHVTQGFSGRIVDLIIEDFPDARVVRLVRDPRATFASPRHQFVNAFGNMYAITPANYFSRLRDLLASNLRMDNGCVYLFWLLYLHQASVSLCRQIGRYPENFRTVRNEDLNTSFIPTIRKLAAWLDVEFVGDWCTEKFIPTVCGAPWRGIGAYNSRYQRAVSGPLENDPDDVANRVTGPNVYVTQRWRSRLNKREIELIEHLYRPELEEFGYEIFYDAKDRDDLVCLVRTALLPFEGEMPTVKWLKKSITLGRHEFFKRLFYIIAFPPFYIISRIILADFVLRRKFFARSDPAAC